MLSHRFRGDLTTRGNVDAEDSGALQGQREDRVARTPASMTRRLAALFVAACISLTLALAACGGNSSPATTGTSSAQGAASSTTSGGGSGGIPQGSNAGDKDADNSGGPSDGDGNI